MIIDPDNIKALSIVTSRFTFYLASLPNISKMENIPEIVSKTCSLTKVVPQSIL